MNRGARQGTVYKVTESDTTEVTWQACTTLTQQFHFKVSPTRLDFFQFDEKVSCQFEVALLLATERIPTDANLNHAKGSDREGDGTPLQSSCLENPWTEEPGGLQSMGSLNRTRLSDFTFTFHFPALEKEMATHSSVLAWRIPGTGEPGGLLSMGLHRVGHD